MYSGEKRGERGGDRIKRKCGHHRELRREEGKTEQFRT